MSEYSTESHKTPLEEITDEQRELITNNIDLVTLVIGEYAAASALMGKDEAQSDGFFGICLAAKQYDATREDALPFRHFAAVCIRQEVVNGARHYFGRTGKKPSVLRGNSAISLATPVLGEDEGLLELGDILASPDIGPQDLTVEKIGSRQELRQLRQLIPRLSPQQQRVLQLHLDGLSDTEIGKELGCSKVNAWGVRKRAIRELQKAYQEILNGYDHE